MLVYLSAALMAVLYAVNVPIRLALSLQLGETNALRVGVGVFEARPILQRVFPISKDRVQSAYDQYNSSPDLLPKLRAALRTGRHVLAHTSYSGVRLRVRLGAGSAHHTAMLSGALWALIRAVEAAGPLRMQADVTPDFERAILRLSLGGMLRVRSGHIMLAALLGAKDLASGRIRKKWTDIPLKAS